MLPCHLLLNIYRFKASSKAIFFNIVKLKGINKATITCRLVSGLAEFIVDFRKHFGLQEALWTSRPTVIKRL